ncbi:MAG: Lrp/AsnC family transcriptional regulator [Nanoarchaeota archaeon]|nr:Lrp/AsnC family transcriptional regulator [Nanoarchaeota archaeon]
MIIDDKDKTLVNSLIRDGRISLDKLSKELKLPVSTVHKRLKNLEKKGLVKGYSPVIDYKMLGYNIILFILIDLVESLERAETIKALKKIQNIIEIDSLQGSDFDIIIKARCRDLSEVDKLLKEVMNIKGIEEVDSMVSGISEKESLTFKI